MFCEKCGSTISNEHSYCPNCGEIIGHNKRSTEGTTKNHGRKNTKKYLLKFLISMISTLLFIVGLFVFILVGKINGLAKKNDYQTEKINKVEKTFNTEETLNNEESLNTEVWSKYVAKDDFGDVIENENVLVATFTGKKNDEEVKSKIYIAYGEKNVAMILGIITDEPQYYYFDSLKIKIGNYKKTFQLSQYNQYLLLSNAEEIAEALKNGEDIECVVTTARAEKYYFIIKAKNYPTLLNEIQNEHVMEGTWKVKSTSNYSINFQLTAIFWGENTDLNKEETGTKFYNACTINVIESEKGGYIKFYPELVSDSVTGTDSAELQLNGYFQMITVKGDGINDEFKLSYDNDNVLSILDQDDYKRFIKLLLLDSDLECMIPALPPITFTIHGDNFSDAYNSCSGKYMDTSKESKASTINGNEDIMILEKERKEPNNSRYESNYENQINKSEFVFWDSDRRYLSEEEIAELDLITIQTAINEIYARHGRKWDNEWDAYFRSKSWYNPQFTKDEISTDVFSKIEKENIDLLAKYRDIKSGK